MDFGWLDAFGGVKDWRLVMPSGYEGVYLDIAQFG